VAITVTEKFESRKSTKGDNPPSSSAELVYTVRGTNDDLAARNAAETTWIPTRTDNPGIIVIQVGQTAPPSPSSPCAAIFDRWNRAGSVAPGCASQISQALAACCSGGSVNNACVNQVARQNAECSGRIPSKDDFIRACTADCVSSYGGDIAMYVCPVGALLGPQPKFPWQKGLYGRSRWTTGYSRISHLMYKLGLKGRTSQAIRSFGKKGAGRFTIHVTVASCAYWAGVYASCHDICTQVANE